jgi:hypothetical protein
VTSSTSGRSLLNGGAMTWVPDSTEEIIIAPRDENAWRDTVD